MKITAATKLSSKIDKGLQYINNRDYDSTIKTFTNKALAQITGYDLRAQCMRLLNKGPIESPARISELSDQAASLSGISTRRKAIDIFRINAAIKTPELREQLEMEIMLLHAEEWLHVLKDLTGEVELSSHSKDIYSLENPYSHEIEVADYFLDRGIPYSVLDNTRWLERYNRKEILGKILGS